MAYLMRTHCITYTVVLLSLIASLAWTEDPSDKRRWIQRDDKTASFTGELEACEMYLPRLPRRILPTHYDLYMEPDLVALSYKGAVEISFTVQEELAESEGTGRYGKYYEPSANQILLHADKSIKIDDVWYSEASPSSTSTKKRRKGRGKEEEGEETAQRVESICYDEEFSVIAITLTKDLEARSSGKLYFTFSGDLRDDGRGFHRSAYRIVSGETLYHAVTDFQPAYARLAFPCFDEPEFRATFDLTLVHPEDRIALANTDSIADGKSMTRFVTTPAIPTYRLAFVVGSFEYLEQEVPDEELRIRVYTPVGRKQEGSFALDTAARALPLLRDFFGTSLTTLNKLDLIAFSDPRLGTGENWGLLSFGDKQLLLNNTFATLQTKAGIAEAIVNQLSHLWLGNLITMDWWDELWFTEGFATWLEYTITDKLYPEFQLNINYLLEMHVHALAAHSTGSAQAIRLFPEVWNEIEEGFDPESLDKSAAVIKMLHDDYLGPDAFMVALKQFILAHSFKGVKADELWHLMEVHSEKQVGKFIKSWIDQPGYPMVKASLSSDGRELELEQERFLSSPEESRELTRLQQWRIPVSVLISNGTEHQQLLEVEMSEEDEDGKAIVDLPSWFDANQPGHWLKLNANFSGFYRVQYESKLLKLAQTAIEQRQMSPLDRLNFVNDALTLFRANQLSGVQLLKILTWFKNEDNGPVLETLTIAYNTLAQIFEHDPSLNIKLKLFGKQLFGEIYDNVKLVELAQEGYIQARGAAKVLSLLVDVDHKPAIGEALQLFESNEQQVEQALRVFVYSAVAKYGSDEQFLRLSQMMKTAHSNKEEQTQLLTAMTKALKQERLNMAWEWFNWVPLIVDRKLLVLSNMLNTEPGRDFIGQLLAKHLNGLVALNGGRLPESLIIEYGISLGKDRSKEFHKLLDSTSIRAANLNVLRNHVSQMLERRATFDQHNEKLLETYLDQYLNISKPRKGVLSNLFGRK